MRPTPPLPRMDAIPGARRHLVHDTGGALLWTHAAEVLTTLLGRAGGDT
ncbi:hypothetical protein OG422_11890 [Streptomyces sp. NBC_01525]